MTDYYKDHFTSKITSVHNSDWNDWIDKEEEEKEKRMDIIGQNGNDGLHYEQKTCPKHYDYVIQPWDYMQNIQSEEAFQGYLEGNIIKYISRWRDKGGIKDLEKAKDYLEKLIASL